jgi:glycosyltransferase involved in cell wall biosynthesis
VLDSKASSFVRERLQGVSLIDTPMDKRCRIVVVVPVHREPVHRVVNLLMSIARQRGLSEGMVEVLCVVNNGPDDGTKIWKAAQLANQLVLDLPLWRNRDGFGAHMRFPAEVLDACREIKESISVFAIDVPLLASGTVGEACNRGLAEAAVRFDRVGRNGVVVFLGADCIVDDPDYLFKALNLFESHPKLVAVSAGVRMVFDPDTRDEEKRAEIAHDIENVLRRKRMVFLERFRQGEDIGLMADDAFINIIARSADAAAWNGFPDWNRNEDSMFGYAAKRYAAEKGKEVKNVKDRLSIVAALRDSDRTAASLKSKLEEEKNRTSVTVEAYEALERLVGASKEGRELIDYLEEPAHILWENYPER